MYNMTEVARDQENPHHVRDVVKACTEHHITLAIKDDATAHEVAEVLEKLPLHTMPNICFAMDAFSLDTCAKLLRPFSDEIILHGKSEIRAISLTNFHVHAQSLQTVVVNCPALVDLTLASCTTDSYFVLINTLRACPMLRYLEFSTFDFTRHGDTNLKLLCEALKRVPTLRELKLRNCTMDFSDDTIQVLDVFAETNPHLTLIADNRDDEVYERHPTAKRSRNE